MYLVREVLPKEDSDEDVADEDVVVRPLTFLEMKNPDLTSNLKKENGVVVSLKPTPPTLMKISSQSQLQLQIQSPN
jgi:hypothetical protein